MNHTIKIKKKIKPFNKTILVDGDKSISIRWLLLVCWSNLIRIYFVATFVTGDESILLLLFQILWIIPRNDRVLFIYSTHMYVFCCCMNSNYFIKFKFVI